MRKCITKKNRKMPCCAEDTLAQLNSKWIAYPGQYVDWLWCDVSC